MLTENPTINAKLIAIDLDGTMVDTAPDLAAAVNAMLLEFGLAMLDESSVRSMIGDGIDKLAERCLATSLGHPPETPLLDRARPVMRRHYADCIYSRSRIYPGVVEALTHWRARGKLLACVTNKASALARPLLQSAGLIGRIDHLYCADEKTRRKPAPVLLLQLIAETGISPEHCVMIGDSVHDMSAAKAAGIPGIAVDYGYGDPWAEADAMPACSVHRLDDLCTSEK